MKNKNNGSAAESRTADDAYHLQYLEDHGGDTRFGEQVQKNINSPPKDYRQILSGIGVRVAINQMVDDWLAGLAGVTWSLKMGKYIESIGLDL